MSLSQRKLSLLGSLALFCAALVWGASFIFQKTSIQHMSPIIFNGLRFLLGAAVLLPVAAISDAIGPKRRPTLHGTLDTPAQRKFLYLGGLASGALLAVASLLQHCGMIYTTAGKAGFITALYILIVPLLGLLTGRKSSLVLWFCVLLGVFGSYLLCGNLGNGINAGDFMMLLCAIGYALQIMVTSHYAPNTDCIRLSIIEFAVAGALSLAFGVITRQPFSIDGLMKAMGAMLYCGVMSSGVGYTFQNIGQRYVHPVTASLLMSLESVLSVFFSWLLIHERMSVRELSGCAIIFLAIIIAQLPNEAAKQ